MSTVVSETTKTGQVYQTAPLRKAYLDIKELHRQLIQSSQQDPLTETLNKIVGHFHEKLCGLERGEALLWRDKIIIFLQRALMGLADPWLGSDGHAYDGKSLTLYYFNCTEQELELSPATGEPNFFLEPHQSAHVSVQWLNKQGVNLEDPEITAAYMELVRKGWALPLPTRQNRFLLHSYWTKVQQIKQMQERVVFAQSLAQDELMVQEFEKEVDRVVQESQESEQIIENHIKISEQHHIQFMQESAQLKCLLAYEQKECEYLKIESKELAQQLTLAHEEMEQLKEAVRLCEEVLENFERQKAKKMMLRVAGTIVNVAFAMGTGLTLQSAFALQAKRAFVSIGVSCVFKDPTTASIVTGAVNGLTEAPLNKNPYLIGAVKGATLPAIDALAKASGLESTKRGAINSVSALMLNSQSVSKSDILANIGIGGISGVLSDETGIHFDLSLADKKLNLNASV